MADFSIDNPAGTIHMSMTDWAKFVKVQMGEHVNGVLLLKPTTLTKLHTPYPDSNPDNQYAMGWSVVQSPYGEVLAHEGSDGCWYAKIAFSPSKTFAVLVGANRRGEIGATAISNAAIGIAGLYLGS